MGTESQSRASKSGISSGFDWKSLESMEWTQSGSTQSELPPPAASSIVSNESLSPASASIDEKRDRRASSPARVRPRPRRHPREAFSSRRRVSPVSLGLAPPYPSIIFYAHSGRKIDVASNFVYRRRRADRERSSGVGVEYGSLSDCP
ncbi:hypothetical protein THAOC_25953 [Thalassiosira oceanica]|uniref:Uncharacterized protein n=1 Tax=Thalassiosira oceanica TaxID=159749 RepID=K0S6B6_THAOC|nr:hypothetical protein THAOC_25953 [Thalassiosira oceanica]|eukprot:EJK54422.1 hypothetical protein THAOC_25953 [Thalassiosira oceanica]